MNLLWYVYLSAAIATHLVKLVVYMKKQQPGQPPLLQELGNYYFGDDEASIKTVGTIAICWVLGCVYIERLGVAYLNLVVALPLHPAVAFLLGFMAEYFGPKIIRAIYHWFTPGGE